MQNTYSKSIYNAHLFVFGRIWLWVGEKTAVLPCQYPEKLEQKNDLKRSRPLQSVCNNLVHLSFLSGCPNTFLKINLVHPSALVTVTFSAASPHCPRPLFTLSGAKDRTICVCRRRRTRNEQFGGTDKTCRATMNRC